MRKTKTTSLCLNHRLHMYHCLTYANLSPPPPTPEKRKKLVYFSLATLAVRERLIKRTVMPFKINHVRISLLLTSYHRSVQPAARTPNSSGRRDDQTRRADSPHTCIDATAVAFTGCGKCVCTRDRAYCLLLLSFRVTGARSFGFRACPPALSRAPRSRNEKRNFTSVSHLKGPPFFLSTHQEITVSSFFVPSPLSLYYLSLSPSVSPFLHFSCSP